jgi:hypothetical protein
MKSLLLSLFICLISTDQLLFVAEVARHGAIYPKNTMLNSSWIKGTNELTHVGIRMHYLIGMHVRNKYSSLLSQYYTPGEIIVYADGFNRTGMSGISQLSGIYPYTQNISIAVQNKAVPPNRHQYSNYQVKAGACPIPNCVSPNPVRILGGTDNLILSAQRFCLVEPKLGNEHNRKGAPANHEFCEKYNKTLFPIVRDKFKLGNDTQVTISTMFSVFDYMYSAMINGVVLNLNFTSEQLDVISNGSFSYAAGYFQRPLDYSMMTMTEVLANISSHFANAIECDKTNTRMTTKMTIFIGHQDTTYPTGAIFDYLYPGMQPYASNIFFELYKGSNGYYVLGVFNSEKVIVSNWTISKFQDYISSHLYKNFTELCFNTNPFRSTTAITLAICLEVAFLIIVVLCFIRYQTLEINQIKVYHI